MQGPCGLGDRELVPRPSVSATHLPCPRGQVQAEAWTWPGKAWIAIKDDESEVQADKHTR